MKKQLSYSPDFAHCIYESQLQGARIIRPGLFSSLNRLNSMQ